MMTDSPFYRDRSARISILIVAGLFITLGNVAVFAQTDDALRDWTVKESAGNETVHARPTELAKGKLTLREPSGAERVISVSDLPEDQRKEALIAIVGSGVVQGQRALWVVLEKWVKLRCGDLSSSLLRGVAFSYTHGGFAWPWFASRWRK